MEIITYKYYNSKKQRLAIKAVETEKKTIEIIIISCSIKDQFSKKLGRMMLTLPLDNVTHDKIFIPNSEGFRKSLFDYLNKNYYRMGGGQIIYDTQELRKGFEVLLLSKKINSKLW